MGMKKSKSARKGKKAWRKISTEDVDDFNEKATKDALSGGPLHSLPSDSIFFLDKSTDMPVKRRTEKIKEKVLRYESVLQKNPFVQAVPSSTMKKKKKKSDKQVNKADIATNASLNDPKANENGGQEETRMMDIWADEGVGTIRGKKKVKSSAIPAVEVEPPGCSFNPDPESHKDTLARAVADEMRKIYQSELGPQPIPLTAAAEVIDEEERYFMEADCGSEDDADEEIPTEDDNTLTEKGSKAKRVTRVELNRRARRKEQLKAEAEAKKKEHLLKEIDCIPDIMQEIVQEEEEKKKRHLRRVVAKQERLKSCPPRLGKRKFEPAPVQVLLSEEISGSLRKLQGCCTLARDRFKSLEKRGLVVPSAKSRRM